MFSIPNGVSGPIPPSPSSAAEVEDSGAYKECLKPRGDLVLSKRGQIYQKHLTLQLLGCKVKTNLLFEVG